MKCEAVKDHIVLMTYGELPDEDLNGVEEHLTECEECHRELAAMRALVEQLALNPVLEPSPNLVAQARMRLDDELDSMPAHGLLTRLRSNWFRWLGNIQTAPALATLLVGLGFLGGNFTYRYQVAHAPKPPERVILTNEADGAIANVSAIVQTPNSEVVQVKYNRVVPETIQGSLDDSEIRKLLVMGVTAGVNNNVRAQSVGLLADECKVGHQCTAEKDGKGIRNSLLVSLRYDKNAGVRRKALEGLQPYVGQDRHVRDAVLEAISHDSDADVRMAAISMLQPVQADSSVRSVLRTVSTQDENPYIRTASFQALQGSGDIQ